MKKVLTSILISVLSVTLIAGCGKKQTLVLSDDVAMSESKEAITDCVKLVDEGRENDAKAYIMNREVILYDNDNEEITIEKEISKTKEGRIAKIKRADGKEYYAYLTDNNVSEKND